MCCATQSCSKENCWEYFHRDHDPDFAGFECPARSDKSYDGIHGGKNGGRFCWHVRAKQRKEQEKHGVPFQHRSCENCSFFLKVMREEGRKFILGDLPKLENLGKPG